MSERILAIETSTLSCSVALFVGDACVHAEQRCEEEGRGVGHVRPTRNGRGRGAG